MIQKTPNLYLPMIEITSSTCDMVENEVEVRLNLLRHVVTTIWLDNLIGDLWIETEFY